MARTYLGTAAQPPNTALDTAVIPVVLTTAARTAAFPSPVTNQRVHNLQTAAIERWNGSAWVTDFAAGGATASVEDLAPGTFGANEPPGPFAFTAGLTLNGVAFTTDGDNYLAASAGAREGFKWAAGTTAMWLTNNGTVDVYGPDLTQAVILDPNDSGGPALAFVNDGDSVGLRFDPVTGRLQVRGDVQFMDQVVFWGSNEVTYGANNSGGTGFRALVIPNL